MFIIWPLHSSFPSSTSISPNVSRSMPNISVRSLSATPYWGSHHLHLIYFIVGPHVNEVLSIVSEHSLYFQWSLSPYMISHLHPHHYRTPTLTHWQVPLSPLRIPYTLSFFTTMKISWRKSIHLISHGMCSITEHFFSHRKPLNFLEKPPYVQLKPRILFR